MMVNSPRQPSHVVRCCSLMLHFGFFLSMNCPRLASLLPFLSSFVLTAVPRRYFVFDTLVSSRTLYFASPFLQYSFEEQQQILFLVHPQSSLSRSDYRKDLIGLDEIGQLQYVKEQLSDHVVKDVRPDEASSLSIKECWVGTNLTSLQTQLYCTILVKHYNLLQSGRLRTDIDSPSLHDLSTQLLLVGYHRSMDLRTHLTGQMFGFLTPDKS
jgi:hypothetical protein